jgi:hypothetical protein
VPASPATQKDPSDDRTNIVGIDRARGQVTNVSVWDSMKHAHAMTHLPAMLAQRPVLEAAGVAFETITNHDALWTITP